MASFSYSDDKVERISSYRIIEEGGFYVGAITEAYDDASKSGAKCIRFTFQSLEGRANFAIYYQSGNGERLIGADMIAGGLLKVVGLDKIGSKSEIIKLYNFDSGAFEDTQKEVYPALYNKALGVVLQKIYYEKRDGSLGFRFDLVHFTDTTGRVASEIRANKEPTIFKKKPEDLFYDSANKETIPFKEYQKRMEQYDPQGYNPQGYNQNNSQPLGSENEEDELPF